MLACQNYNTHCRECGPVVQKLCDGEISSRDGIECSDHFGVYSKLTLNLKSETYPEKISDEDSIRLMDKYKEFFYENKCILDNYMGIHTRLLKISYLFVGLLVVLFLATFFLPWLGTVLLQMLIFPLIFIACLHILSVLEHVNILKGFIGNNLNLKTLN